MVRASQNLHATSPLFPLPLSRLNSCASDPPRFTFAIRGCEFYAARYVHTCFIFPASGPWFNAFLPLSPLLFALSTRYPDNAHTHASLNETEKKKEGRKIGFESGWKQFAMYIYIYTNDRREERDTAMSWTIRFAFHQQWRLLLFFFFFKRGEDRLSGVRLMDTQLNRYLVFRCYFNARCLRIYFFSFFNLLPSFFTHRA